MHISSYQKIIDGNVTNIGFVRIGKKGLQFSSKTHMELTVIQKKHWVA